MPQCALLALSGHSALWHRIFFSELAVFEASKGAIPVVGGVSDSQYGQGLPRP